MSNLLKKTDAEFRYKLLSKIQYLIYLNINKNSKFYEGSTEILFDCSQTTKTLRVDFIFNEIQSIELNGKIITYENDKSALILHTENIIQKQNNLKINYKNLFDSTGSGFHKFVDPEDKEEYLYTDFEPYDAHRLFPCFDQPDLKGIYRLTVEGPDEWVYIHNTNIIKSSKKDKKVILNFEETKKFSTYLFALITGPYSHWTDRHKEIELGLYSRKSLAKFVDFENIFAITKEAFQFLESYFNYPYPYKKYDQIFVPEFNFGAMENIGAVTFSEVFIFRAEKSSTDYFDRANTIYHEMVHMWFGNLVTMKWWNDLWLNESFADYISYYAMSNGKLFPESMKNFYDRKEWAYREDEYPTTHPIASIANDTDEAFNHFDGISYSKGAAIMKQLMFLIGEENFKKSLQTYFQKFSESNTTLVDFLGCLNENFQGNLNDWSKEWLESTGVNTIYNKVKPDKQLELIQLPSKNNKILRTHFLEYTIYSKNNKNEFQLKKTEKIKINQSKMDFSNHTEENEIVILNSNDLGYCRTYIDPISLKNLDYKIGKIPDNFDRKIIWGSLFQMVRDQKLNPIEFLKYTLDSEEKDSSILDNQIIPKVFIVLKRYLNDELELEWSKIIFQLSKQKLIQSLTLDEKLAWFDLFIGTARIRENLDDLFLLLNSEENEFGIKMDQEKRWSVILQLSAFNYKNIDSIMTKEMKFDNSDFGKKKFLQCKISRPDLENKKAYWEVFTKNRENLSTDTIKNGIYKFYWRHQAKTLTDFNSKYFEIIEQIYREKDHHYSSSFGRFLFPSVFANPYIIEDTNIFLKNTKNPPPMLVKDLTQMLAEAEIQINILNNYF